MAERYQIVSKKKALPAENNCPVIVDSYAVLDDTKTNDRIAQIKLQNRASLSLTSCTVHLLDENGNLLIEHEFKKLAINSNEFFGSREPVILPSKVTDFTPVVEKVCFIDDSIWQSDQKDPSSDAKIVSEELPELDMPNLPDEDVDGEKNNFAPIQSAPEVETSNDAAVTSEKTVIQPVKKSSRKKGILAIASGILLVGLITYFLFGWKSKAVRNVQSLISSIDAVVTYDSKASIEAAEDAYNALSDSEKKKVSNYDELEAKKSQFSIASEAYFKKTLKEYASELYSAHQGCFNVWYGIISSGVNVGADYIQTAITCIRMFDENKPLSSYGSDKEDYLWFAGKALCPDNVIGGSVRAGKESDIISNCVSFNKEVDNMRDIKTILPKVQSFCQEFSSQHPDETEFLSKWAETISSTANYLEEPSGTLGDMIDAAKSFGEIGQSMSSYFDLD